MRGSGEESTTKTMTHGMHAIAKQESTTNTSGTNTEDKKRKDKLTLIPLIFLIYFEVSGGPYGAEPAVAAAGPLLAILGFLVFPFVWSIPEALITAELATAVPGNGGFVLWAHLAFGPLAGSLMGAWKFLSGVINNAAYPALCAAYVARAAHPLSGGAPKAAAVAAFTVLLSLLNYTGLAVVGYSAVALGVASLLPFVVMTGAALPKLRPARWGALGRRRGRDWRLYLNTLFWNLNFWDNASALAGEVDKPRRTFPRALLASGILTCLGYLVPLLAATGALDVPQDDWQDGFFADAAGMIAGKWLKYWLGAGAVLSMMGLFEAQLSACAYQLVGMADLGILPQLFAARSKWFGTPWLGILLSSLIMLAISFMTFNDIINSANFLYSLGMLLEFASFLWLRRKCPDLERPYRVPVRIPGLILMCLVPSVFLVYIMVISTWQVFVISIGMTVFAIAMHFLMGFCKSRGYMAFSNWEENRGEEVEKSGEV